MQILAIDIGYHNLAIVVAECDKTEIKIKFCEKVSLQDYKYIHSNDLVDLIPLMLDDPKYKSWFDSSEQILIERQPLDGLLAVQTLIHHILRDKNPILVSPNAMHKHFGFGKLDYDQRKERTVKIATPYLEDNEYFQRLERKHDIADAICMILFQNYHNSIQLKKKIIVEKKLFEEFMYKS